MAHMQETFDAMVWHLRRQKQKSMLRNGLCVYRSPNGLMCAVGFLIPDEDYRRSMESEICDAFPIADVLRKYGHDLPLCRAMQRMHDQYLPKEWEGQFKRIAACFHLKYTPPTKA